MVGQVGLILREVVRLAADFRVVLVEILDRSLNAQPTSTRYQLNRVAGDAASDVGEDAGIHSRVEGPHAAFAVDVAY